MNTQKNQQASVSHRGTPQSENHPQTPTRIEVLQKTFPAYWASALVNGDFSGLDELEAQRCKAEIEFMAAQGCQVVDVVSEEWPRFTWHYNLYDAGAGVNGGEVLDYVIHKTVKG